MADCPTRIEVPMLYDEQEVRDAEARGFNFGFVTALIIAMIGALLTWR